VIGFSSFGVLIYYAVANASAFTQPAAHRRWPRWLKLLGIAGCLTLVGPRDLVDFVSRAEALRRLIDSIPAPVKAAAAASVILAIGGRRARPVPSFRRPATLRSMWRSVRRQLTPTGGGMPCAA
jgi:hypothetical protein